MIHMFRSIQKWLHVKKAQPVISHTKIPDSDADWRELSLSVKEMFASLPVENIEDYEKLNIEETED